MLKTNKTLFATTIVASALLTACGGSTSKNDTTKNTGKNTEAATSEQTVACTDMLPANVAGLLTPGSSCGYLTVPEKHAVYGQPASDKTIQIAVVKLASTSADKKTDPVVFLQGGPGGNATASIGDVLSSGTFIKQRDVYFVDQRGTGYSKPALYCTEYNGEAGTPAQVKSCKERLEKSGVNLDAYHSLHNAKDFIMLFETFDVDQWNLFGTSYGTRLATTIMRENSAGIRSVILDGMFPIEVNGMSDTPWANYETLNQIVKNCENSTNCTADDLKATVEDIISRMHNANMIAESRFFIQNLLGLAMSPAILNYISTVNNDINQYATALEKLMAEGGESEGAEGEEGAEAEGEEDIFYNAMGLSTVCAEEYPFLNTTALTDLNDQGWSAATRIAVGGMHHMGFDKASCEAWDVAPANEVEVQAITSNLPVLILNGQNDSQTPAAWGELVAENMSMAQNVTNPQGGHGQLLLGNTCFENITRAFLVEPNQDVDTSCVAAIPDVTFVGNNTGAK